MIKGRQPSLPFWKPQTDNELPRIREHALRVAVRSILFKLRCHEALSKDGNSSIRKAAAFESGTSA